MIGELAEKFGISPSEVTIYHFALSAAEDDMEFAASVTQKQSTIIESSASSFDTAVHDILKSHNTVAPQFNEGAIVTIHGLTMATEHNGRVVKLVKYDDKRGRWEVSQFGHKLQILIKPDNLKWPEY